MSFKINTKINKGKHENSELYKKNLYQTIKGVLFVNLATIKFLTPVHDKQTINSLDVNKTIKFMLCLKP